MDRRLHQVFHPASVAVTGASPFKSGQLFLDSILASGYHGKVYAINSRGEEISGMQAYRSVADLPGPVDYLICCLPAQAVPQLIRDCATKQVKVVSIFTAGFAESGTQEGGRLEAEVAALARQTGVRVIGPNCLGAYCPASGLSFTADFPRETGKVSYACQSGGNSVYVTRAAAYRGVRFSKVLSYGNACDINECELLEYFAQDKETEIVALYIEGVCDGQRFFKALRELCEQKPVVVLKGGYTASGAETAASHTGALAGSDSVFDQLLHQTGAIRVYSLEELVDMLVALDKLPDLDGNRVGIFGGGGGASVLATDDWAGAGFVLPPLPGPARDKLRGMVSTEAGLILRNPLDLSSFAYSEGFYGLIKDLLTLDDFVDFSVIHIGFGQAAWFSTSVFDSEINLFRDAVARLQGQVNTPLIMVMQYLISGWDWNKGIEELQRGLAEAGVPVFYTMSSAAKTMARLLRFCERRRLRREEADIQA